MSIDQDVLKYSELLSGLSRPTLTAQHIYWHFDGVSPQNTR